MKFKYKIGLYSLIISAIPIIIVGFTSYNKSAGLLIDNKMEIAELTVEKAAGQIRQKIEQAVRSTDLLVKLFEEYGIEEGVKSLEKFRIFDSGYKHVYFGEEKTGRFYIRPEIELPEGYDPRKRPWYAAAVDDKSIVSKPYMGASTEVLEVTISRSVIRNGKRIGVIGIDLELTDISKEMSDIKIGKTGYIFVLYKDGTVLVHNDAEMIGKNLINNFKFIGDILRMKNGKLDYNYNEEKFIIIRTLKEFGWTICGGTYYSEIKSQLNILRNFTLIVLLISSLVIVCGIYYITNTVTLPIERIIKKLYEISSEISSASNQVSLSSQSIAESASTQAASVEETTSSLEQMSSMTGKNADNADRANILVKEAGQVVTQANENMHGLISSMDEVTKASRETKKIIKTIDEIAFQTNLLSLNASIEAARAGEAGIGFAVVAGEVRNLAMRAGDSAKSTAELIDETVKKIETGNNLLNLTNSAFSSVSESVGKSSALVSEIAAASNEQAMGIKQINIAITEINEMIQQNAACSQESTSTVQELDAQSKNMKSIVDDLYKLIGG